VKGGTAIDQKPYNGWPNIFTWHVYTHVSSYEETYNAARTIVACSSTPFLAAEALSEWVQEIAETLYEACSASGIQLLSHDLTLVALGQVDWNRLVKAFQE